MRKVILTMATIAFMVLTIGSTYGQEPDKQSQKAREDLKEAKSDVVDAKQDLATAQKDSISDYQKFKKESDVKIKDNEKSIADLKTKSTKVDAKNKATYDKKVSEFEQKNIKLKKDLADYKDGEPSKWTTFKSEFNHDINELGKSLKDFTVNNKI